ncbi:MAG: hypothetical protein J5J06_05575 [Phycisphaerae bacterium]|nr:hypothetical protein [Phycisphaerae bacterium]
MPISVLTEEDFKSFSHDEARRRFARKTPLSAGDFEELSVRQRRTAFRIATVHKAVIVQMARDELEKAIAEGRSFAEFRERLYALLDTKGLPRPAISRLRLAFHQNTMQAYSDSRRAVLDDPDIAAAFPFRQYWTVGNGVPGVRNVREDHAVLHGKIFRWNDPFWDRFTPPWDFGCRCTTAALTEGQFRATGQTLWTFSGGRVRPVSDKRAKPFRLKPNANYESSRRGDLLTRLDEDLREAIGNGQ